MGLVIDDVLVRDDPVGDPVPVVFDSPHSGVNYPRDFDFICPLAALRQAEDTYVEELFAAAPEFGATLLYALFPRSYIDVNRAADDIIPALLDEPWPGILRPSDKSAAGIGLIRSQIRPGQPVYDGRLSVAEVAERIDRYYRPYHFQTAEVLDGLADRFGQAWLVDCHSMPSAGLPSAPPSSSRRRGWGVDFVIGDRDGTTCERGFVDFIAQRLRAMGYSTTLNKPYKGVEMVRRYGDPARGRHAVQLEINRSLYMNEETLEKTADFDDLRSAMTALAADICSYAAAATARGQAAE
ncbi:MAG TPA: N-formylglutamate amidohydrolase [Azospirillaceae bacterium]|nr:N-formylglutamate amidohydrolase [Azospirillaceae bacterium]HRQ82132.1 N-formylglutamate amidohydrolase [Azospirillaceae bacterium]